MKGFAISVLLLVLGSSTFCQVNLVLNGDFETYIFCPRGYDDIKACVYWSGIDSMEVHNCDIMDYCHSCANVNTNDFVSIPQARAYYQFPHSGSAFTEVMFYFNNGSETTFWRHYLQGRFRKKLTAGKRYCVSFWVNLAEGSKYAVKELSAYLDNGSIDTTTMCGAPQTQYTPQITWSGSPITDTANWVKVEGSFVANGTEQFITLGTYKDKNQTTKLVLPDNPYNIRAPYWGAYLVDDVSVVPSDTKADAGPDRHIGYGDSVYIGRPSAEAIWCDWRVKGFSTIIGQGPGIWVKPTTTTSYVMSQTLCDYTTTDTVKVYVGETGISNVGAADAQQYMLIPNPNDGNITLLQKLADAEPVSIKVYNSIGAVVSAFDVAFDNNASILNLSNIPTGVYYMILRNSAGESYHLTFVKK